MVKCDNCDVDATLVMSERGASIQHFCDKHLPKIYVGRASAVEVPVEVPVVEAIVEEVVAPTPRKRKKSTDENSTEDTDEAGTPSP
jgi:hypothetical protein